MTTYQKRHQHMSPTMDFAAKKDFNLKEPIKNIEVADQMLDTSRLLSKEERAMLDERLLRQEHHDMDIYSAREEGIELGIAQEKRQMVRAMFKDGLSANTICRIADITESELSSILNDDISLD